MIPIKDKHILQLANIRRKNIAIVGICRMRTFDKVQLYSPVNLDNRVSGILENIPLSHRLYYESDEKLRVRIDCG